MASYDDVINLALRRSIFYPASDIYKGPAGFYSYGPYGVAIRNKMVEQWRKLLLKPDNMLEIDSSIALPESVLKASGHVDNFADPMSKCANCHSAYRTDKLLTEITETEYTEAMNDDKLVEALKKHQIKCPSCKKQLEHVERPSSMVKAEIGLAKKIPSYLRPETCQSIFLDFQRLHNTMRMKLPQGIAQIGKAYRNEISPRNGLLRQIEFYQAEAEIFFNETQINNMPEFEKVKDVRLTIKLAHEDENRTVTAQQLVDEKIVSGKLIAYYLARSQEVYDAYGFSTENTRFRQLDDEERAFYAKEAWDYEVNNSFGWMEISGHHYRTDHDLAGHGKGSKKDLSVVDDKTGKKYVPHVWEISFGFDRIFYSILENSLHKKEDRQWLALPKILAPAQVAVFPLLKNKPKLVKKAEEVKTILEKEFDVIYDDSGSIGKRYARVDEIGIPYCITIDFDTIEKDNSVTVRNRDTAEQKRVTISNLHKELKKLLTRKKSF